MDDLRSVRLGSIALGLVLLVACGGDKAISVFNTPPAVSILEPVDGSSTDAGNELTFLAVVDDDGGPAGLVLQWASDADGVLFDGDIADSAGNVEFVTSSLSAGSHTVTLSAVDADAELGEDSVTVVINAVADAPTIVIVTPADGELGYEGEPFEFRSEVGDAKDAPEQLDVTVFSDVSGTVCVAVPDGAGVARCTAALFAGNHLLSFEVIDTDGNKAVVSRYFSVLAPSDVDNDGDGFSENQGDCDDDDDEVYPAADESLGQGVDNDCDGIIDEGTVWYDDDGDGQTELGGDCDDSAAHIYNGAPEIADFADNDCDGVVDEGTDNVDDDLDGFSEVDGDCDDADDDVYPGATEVCDLVDNDCDTVVNEEGALGCLSYYADADSDGYGYGAPHCLCAPDATYKVASAGDCYDLNAQANPTQTAYFPTHRGDGSFDYNCNGSDDKQTTTIGGCSWEISWSSFCDEDPAGWDGSAPACGGTGNWIWDCSFSIEFDCNKDSYSEVMSCH